MFRHLLMILFRPHVTVNRLLQERKRTQSFAATLFLFGANLLVAFLLYVFTFRTLNQSLNLPFLGSEMVQGIYFMGVVIFAAVALVIALVFTVGSRYVFSWMVQLGLRFTMRDRYPQAYAQRREKAMLLRLIHPYTLWMQMVPVFLALILLPLIVNLSDLANLITDLGLGLEPSSDQGIKLLTELLVYGFAILMCSLGMWIYMIIVRTSAIQKIFEISTVLAFWSTFLMYVLLYLGLVIVGVLVLLGFVIFGGNPVGTGWI